MLNNSKPLHFSDAVISRRVICICPRPAGSRALEKKKEEKKEIQRVAEILRASEGNKGGKHVHADPSACRKVLIDQPARQLLSLDLITEMCF